MPHTDATREELAAQQGFESNPEVSGVAVRLYAPLKMSSPNAGDFHPDISIRVWMAGEFSVLTDLELVAAKKLWDGRKEVKLNPTGLYYSPEQDATQVPLSHYQTQ